MVDCRAYVLVSYKGRHQTGQVMNGSNGNTGKKAVDGKEIHTITVEWRGVTKTLEVTWVDLIGWHTLGKPFLAQIGNGKKLYPVNTYVRPKPEGGFRLALNVTTLNRPARITAWNERQEPAITKRRGYKSPDSN